jgi:cysteine-rich repeat protein
MNPLNVAANTTLNFGNRTVIIGFSRQIGITGGVTLTINAGAFIMRGGARIGNAAVSVANGANLNVNVANDIKMERALGESRSRIEVPGTLSGGQVQFTAGRDIEIDGELRANGTTLEGSGGGFDLSAGRGVTLAGTVNVAGDIGGLGGDIFVVANGPIVVNAPVDASGGDGGSIDLSGASVSTTGILDVRGKAGGGSGGGVAISVDASITIGKNIFLQGSGAPTDGGFGGELELSAPGGSIFLNDVIDISGGSPGGFGGAGFFEAGVDIIQKRPVFAIGAGTGGSGGELDYGAGRLLSLEATNDVSGAEAGGLFSGNGQGEVQAKSEIIANGDGIGGSAGSIDLDGLVPGISQVSGNVVVSGALRTRGDDGGGDIDILGCGVTIGATGVLNNSGPGSKNTLQAGGLLTVAGRVEAIGGANTLLFRDPAKPPVVDLSKIQPPAGPAQSNAVPGCQPPVPPLCGNGEIEAVVPSGFTAEGCDDDNLTSCDGCSGAAPGTDGTNCHASGCCQEEACGNGRRECDEECDDGNVTDGDGCDSNCTTTACGNGRVTGTEECDDDNTTPGDGCDAGCLIEPPPGCGNGMVAEAEECDDGNNTNCDGCSKICVQEGCGNGVRECAEVCDDGGIEACDGECAGNCSRLVDQCGDGIKECNEQCDAGASNGAPNTACSGFCQICDIGSGADCPCATDFDCHPGGRCAGIACLSGSCSQVDPLICDDHNACNGTEACVNGVCVTTPLNCDDGDPCTDDACTPAGGCPSPHPRKTGFPGISCRLDLIKSLADAAAIADLQTKLRDKILTLSEAARTGITGAESQASVKKQRKLLKGSEGKLGKLIKAITKGLKKKQVSETLANRMREQADGARTSTRTLRAGLTG